MCSCIQYVFHRRTSVFILAYENFLLSSHKTCYIVRKEKLYEKMSKLQIKDSHEILKKDPKESSFVLKLKNVNATNFICA